MIKVENLTKRYAGQTAIRDLNFEVGQGEIMGFLGPNGAGKTTTMRILAGFMPATSGRASIAGFDVFEQSLQARSRLGYMPENVPLYNDMRVTEYLDYRAALKGVPHRRVAERVGDVKELCGLREVERKLIGALSKGYRQRVGLADALVNEPELLILDEPTIGLDPNQIRQVRELIKNLGKQHTILLSTHILPEVEMTCSRVIIVHKGRIEACDTPENLLGKIRQAGGVELEAKVGNDNGEEQYTIQDALFDSVFFWFSFVLIVPLITMRLFAEEFKLGTIEPLTTAPVRDWQVVLSKFLGALVFYLILWIPTLIYFWIFARVTNQPAAHSPGAYFGSYLMLLLLGMFYLSIGCLTSVLTRNQIIAAIISFCAITLLFFLGLVQFILLDVTSETRDLLGYFSAIEHMGTFSRGVIDTRPIVLYVSMTIVMLMLTYQVFQSRKWRL